jgi:hypothetical protein
MKKNAVKTSTKNLPGPKARGGVREHRWVLAST